MGSSHPRDGVACHDEEPGGVGGVGGAELVRSDDSAVHHRYGKVGMEVCIFCVVLSVVEMEVCVLSCLIVSFSCLVFSGDKDVCLVLSLVEMEVCVLSSRVLSCLVLSNKNSNNNKIKIKIKIKNKEKNVKKKIALPP